MGRARTSAGSPDCTAIGALVREAEHAQSRADFISKMSIALKEDSPFSIPHGEPMSNKSLPASEIILYQTEDGRTRIQCRFEGETLWLTQAQIAELFGTSPQNVTMHLKAIFADGELVETATCKDYLQVRSEGGREVARKLCHYRLEAILAVGFRVRSPRGTQFRQWAIRRLDEYRKLLDTQPQRIDAEFEKVAKELKRLPKPKKTRPTKASHA